MVRLGYARHRFMRNDFIGPVGSYDLHLISGAPPERSEYLTLTKPFDSFTWVFTLISLVTVSIALICIEKLYATWSKESYDDTVFHCKCKSSKTGILAIAINSYSLGIEFSFGAIIDRNNLRTNYDKDYAFQQSGSKARTWIVSKWIIVAFFLTISYKSVLLAMLMNIYYEDTIDSVDDMLASDRSLVVASDAITKVLLLSDPRKKVKMLQDKTIFYESGQGAKGLADKEHLAKLARG